MHEPKPPLWAGYLCALIASVCFGSNFVPVKFYENKIGNGLFFQWVFCSAVFFCGFIVYVTREFPPFEPLAILGGFLWCTGNILSVPIIKCIGLSLGMLIWGIFNLVMGWASGTFGLFGLAKETVQVEWLNYLGGVLALVSGVFFAELQKIHLNPNKFKQLMLMVTVLRMVILKEEIGLIRDLLCKKES